MIALADWPPFLKLHFQDPVTVQIKYSIQNIARIFDRKLPMFFGDLIFQPLYLPRCHQVL